VSNKKQEVRREIERQIETHWQEASDTFSAYDGLLTEADEAELVVLLEKDWPFDDRPVDDSDSCLPEIDWGENALQKFVEQKEYYGEFDYPCG
jgi:hypothetical protein